MSDRGNGVGRTAKRVFVVDPQPIVRLGFSRIVSAQPDFSLGGEAGSMAEALAGIAETSADLVVADIVLQDRSGLELVKQVSARSPLLPILVFSAHDEVLFAERALAAGALGYLRKDETPEELLNAMRWVVSGRIYLSPKMTQRLLHLVSSGNSPNDSGGVASLSDRELEVFELFGRGATTREIARRLHLSVKTIETHREHIKLKLHLKNASELMRYAVEWELTKRPDLLRAP
jgi:DNA-binding NarL/FixJ family response regulator